MTQEEIITYKFAAIINDTKAWDKFIKGPLKLQLVLGTIELDNFNRKYSDKKSKNRKQRKTSSGNSSDGEQIAYTKPIRKENRMKCSGGSELMKTATFAYNQSGRRMVHPEHGRHGVIIVRKRDTLPKYADQRP